MLGTVARTTEDQVGEKIWMPLTGWVSVSGSSVSSRGSKVAEGEPVGPVHGETWTPLMDRVNTSGSSSESRVVGKFDFERPTSYILRCKEMESSGAGGGEEEDEETASGQRGVKRPPSDDGDSDSDDCECHNRDPDPRGCNGDSSDKDYKEDPFDGDKRKSQRPSWLPSHLDDRLRRCPVCQMSAYGARCYCTSSSRSSSGSSTSSSYMSRFRCGSLIKKRFQRTSSPWPKRLELAHLPWKWTLWVFCPVSINSYENFL